MPEPEAGDDLVEDQQRAVLVAQLAHAGVEVARQGAGAALRPDRLDEHRGRAAAGPVEPQGPLRASRSPGKNSCVCRNTYFGTPWASWCRVPGIRSP